MPSRGFEVIAYGDEEFSETVEKGLVEKKPYWDGLAAGGQYAVLSKEISRQYAKDISKLHDEDEVGDSIATLDDDGEKVEVQIAEISDLEF